MFNNVGNIVKLSKLVAVVVAEHTLGAHDGMAKFAEVFNFFVLMLEAEDFPGI